MGRVLEHQSCLLCPVGNRLGITLIGAYYDNRGGGIGNGDTFYMENSLWMVCVPLEGALMGLNT